MISTSSNKIDEIVAPDEIETYVSMPSCLLQGCSNDLIIFRADGGNHFTHYGIYEGMFLIFDVSKDFKEGRLSCYLNNSGDDRPKFKVSDKPLDGYPVTLGTDTFGNITRLDNALEGLPKRLEMNEMELDNIKKQFETAKVDVERPFPQEEGLKAKTDRLNELNALLNVDKRENEIVGGEPDEGDEPPEKKSRDLER